MSYNIAGFLPHVAGFQSCDIVRLQPFDFAGFQPFDSAGFLLSQTWTGN